MEPIARIEIFLAVIAGENYELPVPQTRVELFLANIAGESYELPAPEARVELYLAKILGQNVTLPVPQSRIDRYLAAIAGEAVDPPEYWTTRVEYWLAKWAEGSGGQIVTVTGVAPLLLERALAKQIQSLTQYGLCTQSATPTPSAPVDIMCNNGTIHMVDDELPSGYTRLTYIESDGTSGDSGSNGYVDTGIIINSIDTDAEIDFQLTDTYAPSPRMAWGYMGTPSSLPRWGFGAYGGKWLGSPNATAGAGEVDTRRHVAVMRVYSGGSNSAFYNGTLDGETLYNTNNLGNVSIFEDNDRWPVYLFARNNNNTAANFVPCKIFRFKVYEAGALTHDLVPCKDGNGALGFYDLVTATFSVASGTLIAGAADYSHSHIGADGTPETLTLVCNYASGGLTGNGTYVSPTTTAGNRAYKWLDVPNGAYQFSVDGDYEIIVQWRDPADPSFAAQSYENLTGWITSGTVTLDKPSGGYGVTVRRTSGTSITPSNFDGTLYCYRVSDIQTVTDIPMLLSVNDYKDESEIISGLLTHKVGI